MNEQPSVDAVIEQIAPRLRRARTQRGFSLTDLARATGLSTSTLSRLECGLRKPSLELLLPITVALGAPLDEIVTAPRIAEPPAPRESGSSGRVVIPLSHRGRPRADKIVIPAHDAQAYPRTHEGYEWIYVLRGRLRLCLGGHDVVMHVGEAAQFDCRVPHWFGAAGVEGAEILSLFGAHGERMHLRTRPTSGH
ncbi:MAG: helix-turn-helix transcriptional regulator [Nocardia sp.]|nr:helix-turn-helix transcriptional regulator [Nocardia sp.]NUS92212.1 helix-turn-helix transcriptional regulator [Nocardia sp.]